MKHFKDWKIIQMETFEINDMNEHNFFKNNSNF